MLADPVLNEWYTALRDADAAGTLVSIHLKKPTATAGDARAVDVRPILVKRQAKLSFTYHYRTRDVVKNYMLDESVAELGALLRDRFTTAMLRTTTLDIGLSRQADAWCVKRHAPSHTTVPDLSHDRPKQRLISNAAYLHALGITDAQGKVHPTAQDKFRQINKYIEIIDGLVRPLPMAEMLRVVDMGAGKGYLTFALYDHLVHRCGRKVSVVGVELRPELVAQSNAIAEAMNFTGLQFVQGSIADYDCAGADIVIALHACDTVTDDAIAKAVQASAQLIIMAPCCHKQLRRAMQVKAADASLAFLLRHGTYAERIAEMLTDGLRAQLLELHGYRIKLFEFIGGEHTPKNVMIVGSKSTPLAVAARDALRAEIAATRQRFAIEQHYLEALLDRD